MKLVNYLNNDLDEVKMAVLETLCYKIHNLKTFSELDQFNYLVMSKIKEFQKSSNMQGKQFQSKLTQENIIDKIEQIKRLRVK